jgi:putative nucleotidyltransferase with HDIG domain
MRLFGLLAAVLVVVSLVPLAISDWGLISSNRESLETHETKYLSRSAVLLAEKIGAFYQGVQNQLRNLSNTMLYSQSLSGRDPFTTPSTSAFLQDFLTRQRSEILALRVVDPQLHGFGSENLPPPVQEEFDRGFRSALEGIVYTGYPINVAGFPAPVAIIAVPVRDDVGDILGVVEGLISWESVMDDFREESRAGVRTYVVDRTPRVVLSVGPPERIERSSLVQDFKKYPVRQTSRYLLGGKDLLGSIAPVGTPDWGVLVERDTRLAFASVDQMIRETILLSIVALLFAVIVGLLFARGISHPIGELAETTRAIAEGEYGRQVEIRGAAEIAELSTTFNLMSASIEQAVEGLQKAARENHELFINSVRALAAAIDAKDPYTRGHSERVAIYATSIAKAMGLPMDLVRKIRLAALLHDVGKIGIDDRILRKPTALTEEEFEIMKTHPVKGATIMSAIPQLADIIPGMRHHHEKWEGGGYPDGIAGEQIPLMARVVTVADVFDAMTTTRPYQKAMETDYVVQRIKSLSGTRFESRIVDAFVSAYESGDLVPRTDGAPVAVKTVA